MTPGGLFFATAGFPSSAAANNCDFAMVSRELKKKPARL